MSIVVVSRNRVERLRRCLESVEKSDARNSLELIVVDNGSTDGSAQLDEEFHNVQFIRLPKNFGLTKGLNLGWRAANAEYVLFLHDDTELAPPTPGLLADALDARSDASAVCPLLVNDAGKPAPQLGKLPPDGEWQPAAPPGTDPFPVEYPRGAALMVRVFVIKAIRQIDERYGQFGSDADLAAQIQRAGKKVLLVPSATARHYSQGKYAAPERADFLLGRAVFLGKYRGFGAGLQARLAAIFSPLFGFRLSEFSYTVGGKKIDGTQG